MKRSRGENVFREPTRNGTEQGAQRGVRTRAFKGCIKITKKSLGVIVGILTGHGRVNYHVGKLRISVDAVCKFCEERIYIRTMNIYLLE